MPSHLQSLAVAFLLSIASTVQTPAFDVASVRQSPPGSSVKGTDLLSPFTNAAPKGGLFSTNAPLFLYIIFAYKITDSSQFQSLAQSMPSWAQSDKFDIEARVDGAPPKEQVQLMLRSLLEDRFKLKAHFETKQQPIYALVLDKPGVTGAQLRSHPADAPCVERPGDAMATIAATAPPPYCGTALYRHDGRFHLRFISSNMKQIAIALGGAAGLMGGMETRAAIDQTDLQGLFDVDLEFSPETPTAAGPIAGPQADGAGPTFSDALKSQVGLKFVKQTGPVSTLIIDHVEKPSEN
jgi:uncharacterized protein (TIGR03435 family)